jgi:hypothetical protein
MKMYTFCGYLISETSSGWHISKDGNFIATYPDEIGVRDLAYTLMLMNAEDGEE